MRGEASRISDRVSRDVCNENALRGHRPHAGNGIQLLCGRGIEIDPRICGGPIVRTVTPLLR